MNHEALPVTAPDSERAAHYAAVRATLEAILEDEDDWISAMATVACELHHAFEYYHWTGFYRVVDGGLRVGPYQGGHGCLRIDFTRGVCGAAARTCRTQLVPDVHAFPGHIACSSSTLSEIVVPILHARDGHTIAVFDVDSDHPAAFTEADQRALESLASMLAERFSPPPL